MFDDALDTLEDGDDVATQATSKTLTEDNSSQIQGAAAAHASSDLSVSRDNSPELGAIAVSKKRLREEQVDHAREIAKRIALESGSARKNPTPKRRCAQKNKSYYFGLPEDETEAYARTA